MGFSSGRGKALKMWVSVSQVHGGQLMGNPGTVTNFLAISRDVGESPWRGNQ
jgi:hypothetical protein